MRRSVIGLIVTLGFLVTPLCTNAQPPQKIPRIGLLCPTTCGGPALAGFLQGLRDRGYMEGQNILLEYRQAEGRFERLPDLAAELVRLNVDVIEAASTAVWAAKNATSTLPIVFGGVATPVEAGLVASLAQPSGNITGVATMPTREFSGKLLELLKETLPGAARVAVLYNPASGPAVPALAPATSVLRVELQPFEVRSPEDFEGAFEAARRARADALFVRSDPLIALHRARIAALAQQHRLPAIAISREFAEAGVLMTYGVSIYNLFQRTAYYVDRILKGAKPADLPVEQPTKFELVINLKTAQAFGLNIPPTVLFRADEVIR
jgi:putative tryptophan/tyrosine transport system substrate-binding protein